MHQYYYIILYMYTLCVLSCVYLHMCRARKALYQLQGHGQLALSLRYRLAITNED